MKSAGISALLLMLAVGAVAQSRAPNVPGSMQLKPGDRMKLRIFQEEDMSGEFNIPSSGVIVLPKIGPRKVTDIPIGVLQDSIVHAFRAFLREWVSIDLVFERRITVLGAVREPGIVYVDETMTIAEALALAGGVDREGRPDEVQLYRGDQKLVSSITRSRRIADLPLESGDQLFVPERNWFSRNMPLVAALVSGVVSVGVAVLVRKN